MKVKKVEGRKVMVEGFGAEGKANGNFFRETF